MYNVDWAAIRGGVPQAKSADQIHARKGALSRVFPRVSPVVWSLGVTSLLTDVSSEMVSSILPVYLLLFLHVSPAAFGVIDGLYQGFAVIVRTASGFLGDRWRRHKLVATAGYGLSAVCRLAILGVGSAWTGIATVVAVDRTGKGIRTAPRDAMISLATPKNELATAFGVHRALDAAGAMLGPLVAFGILAAMPRGFDVIFLVSFCVAVLGVAVIALFVHEPAHGDAATASSRSVGHALSLFAAPGLRGIAVAAAVLSVATVSDSFIFLTLQRQVAFNAGMFPLLFVGVSLVNFFLSAPLGRAADRLGRSTVFLAGHAVLWAAYGVLIMPGSGLARLIVCLVLVGAYYAATDGVLAAITSARMPRELVGSGLSVIASITNLGRFGASVLFGIAWTAWGLQGALIVFIIGLAAALITSMIVLPRAAGADASADPA